MGKGSGCLFPMCGKARGYVWTATPLMVCMMPISVLLTLITSLCVFYAIFPHGRLIIPHPNSLQGESSSLDMTPIDAFMELCHDVRTLILAHVGEDGVCVAMSKQLSIYQGIPAWVLFNYLSLHRLYWEHSISKVTPIRCYLGFAYVDLTGIQQFLSRQAIDSHLGHLQRFLCQRSVPSFSPSKVSTCGTSPAQHATILGDVKVSWMTDLWRPPLPELGSLASRSARAFYSLGTYTNSNARKVSFKSTTYFKYEAICGSFAWYSHVTCPVTSSC